MMMEMKSESTGFWEGGFTAFTDELARREEALLALLESELKAAADPARKKELERQIAAVKADFEAKRKDAMYSLFGKG